ncbi:FAD-dependent oxidoreductase [Leucobacter sp. UT-8R-CII-1-4]|uniref:FAD-dependent oxidoreductase n=1 Tax=Leucobacter sp. UT-8R-CII-1-4 TaxID=3040075 RepID=UPI0024A7FD53|nr:FAD-dependent oxidoreductase [Leucobacter sp. UT-8R-CII-1-4]MDI6022197.1 FAD-dependent oxidoreductase [Leucobacter sp. UT-8R-CII-1-4]
MSSTLEMAIIGSGPAGCYLAQSIQRMLPEANLTIIDRLPVPFGLIRYGVAADHQHTKAITRQFDRLFVAPNVRFAGNIEVGTDVSVAELRAAFDTVVFATGLYADNSIHLPGEELAGVYGSGTITRLLNSHPAERSELPTLGEDVVIVGGGNVAIDLLRFLVKTGADYQGSDIAEHALASYLESPAARVTLLNRSQITNAKSDPQMLAELAKLEAGNYQIFGLSETIALEEQAGTLDRQATARLAALRALQSREAAPGASVRLRFGATPVRLVGDQRVSAIEFEQDGKLEQIEASSVLIATGFSAGNDPLATYVATPSQTGRIEMGLYRTGWAKRGPRGAIPENRACAKAVAEEIVADLAESTGPIGRGGFESLPEDVRTNSISYEQWHLLDAHERAQAGPDRVRRKILDTAEMLRIARRETQ